MPRYGDDQCSNCGGIRVAKSTLCADCLVAAYSERRQRFGNLMKEKIELEAKNKKLTALNERLLDHITQEAAYGDEEQQLRYLAWLEDSDNPV